MYVTIIHKVKVVFFFSNYKKGMGKMLSFVLSLLETLSAEESTRNYHG